MRELIKKIPHPNKDSDSWNGSNLPPTYENISPKQKPIWFVDGGNASILSAPHFALEKLRAVAVHYPDKKIIKEETIALISRSSKEWHITFSDGKEIISLAEELTSAIDEARKQLEHKVALKALEQNNGIVVLDGDEHPQGCYSLQKSISTLTNNGFALSSVLTKKGPWSAKLGKVWAVKLSSRAKHVFLLHSMSVEEINTTAYYSQDTLFPGYPAGLVLADRLARVSNEELKSLQIKARAELKELRAVVDEAQSATDSHAILDSMG